MWPRRRCISDTRSLHTHPIRSTALVDLQAALPKAGDPQGLASKRNVDFSTFAGSRVVQGGITILETDLAVQPVRCTRSVAAPAWHPAQHLLALCAAAVSVRSRQVVGEDADAGATSRIGPYGPDGANMLLASTKRMSVIEAAWNMYQAANDVAIGIAKGTNASTLWDAAALARRVDDSELSGPAVCSGVSYAPWTFVINGMSGNQFHEHMQRE